jgi:hypothetical protein
MRRQNLVTASLAIWIETNSFKPEQRQYDASKSVRLPVATADTGKLIAAAMTALGIIFKPGYRLQEGGRHVSRSGAIWPCARRPVRSARRRAVGRGHACDRSAQCPLRPWRDRLRHGRRTPSLEPSAGIRFAALHNGLERVAARLKRNLIASKDPFGPPMLFTSAHRGPSIARLVQTGATQTWGHQSIFGIESA